MRETGGEPCKHTGAERSRTRERGEKGACGEGVRVSSYMCMPCALPVGRVSATVKSFPPSGPMRPLPQGAAPPAP